MTLHRGLRWQASESFQSGSCSRSLDVQWAPLLMVIQCIRFGAGEDFLRPGDFIHGNAFGGAKTSRFGLVRFFGRPVGLEHPITLGFLGSFIDQLLGFAAPLVILVFTGGLRRLAAG